MHGSKHCFEGQQGSVVAGAVVVAVHVNKVAFNNFLLAGSDQVQSSLADPYYARICGQNSTRFFGQVYQGTCGRVLHRDEVSHKSGSGIWYCKACKPFRIDGSPDMTFAICNGL